MRTPSLPEATLATIRDYVDNGLPPGDFLRAVLENNLREAFGRADSENTAAMRDIVCYLYNHVPSICWGSKERVQAWLSFKDQQRKMQTLAKHKFTTTI